MSIQILIEIKKIMNRDRDLIYLRIEREFSFPCRKKMLVYPKSLYDYRKRICGDVFGLSLTTSVGQMRDCCKS